MNWILEWFQNGPQVEKKLTQNGPKIGQKSCNGSKIVKTPISPGIGLRMELGLGPEWTSEWATNGPEIL